MLLLSLSPKQLAQQSSGRGEPQAATGQALSQPLWSCSPVQQSSAASSGLPDGQWQSEGHHSAGGSNWYQFFTTWTQKATVVDFYNGEVYDFDLRWDSWKYCGFLVLWPASYFPCKGDRALGASERSTVSVYGLYVLLALAYLSSVGAWKIHVVAQC